MPSSPIPAGDDSDTSSFDDESSVGSSHDWTDPDDDPDDEDPDDEDDEQEPRLPFMAINCTREEVWACLVALKICKGLSDDAVLSFADLLNMMAEGTASQPLPTSAYLVRQELQRALPSLGMTYHAFCVLCHDVIESSSTPIKEATCDECRITYIRSLDNGQRQFTTFSVVAQLEVYLRHGGLGRVMRHYRQHYLKIVGHLPVPSRIARDGDISLTAFIDAAPMTSRAGVSQMPVLLFVNEIPVGSQHRYPLLGAMFCARGAKPPSRILVTQLLAELRETIAKPVEWMDDLGHVQESRVYLTRCSSDYPGKCEILGHKQGGYYGCPYCEEEG